MAYVTVQFFSATPVYAVSIVQTFQQIQTEPQRKVVVELFLINTIANIYSSILPRGC